MNVGEMRWSLNCALSFRYLVFKSLVDVSRGNGLSKSVILSCALLYGSLGWRNFSYKHAQCTAHFRFLRQSTCRKKMLVELMGCRKVTYSDVHCCMASLGRRNFSWRPTRGISTYVYYHLPNIVDGLASTGSCFPRTGFVQLHSPQTGRLKMQQSAPYLRNRLVY